MRIRQILQSKRLDVVVISPDSTIHAAINLMKQERVGSLVVIDRNRQLLGVLSERDVIHRSCRRRRAGTAPSRGLDNADGRARGDLGGHRAICDASHDRETCAACAGRRRRADDRRGQRRRHRQISPEREDPGKWNPARHRTHSRIDVDWLASQSASNLTAPDGRVSRHRGLLAQKNYQYAGPTSTVGAAAATAAQSVACRSPLRSVRSAHRQRTRPSPRGLRSRPVAAAPGAALDEDETSCTRPGTPMSEGRGFSISAPTLRDLKSDYHSGEAAGAMLIHAFTRMHRGVVRSRRFWVHLARNSVTSRMVA